MANKFYGGIGVNGGSDGFLDDIDGGNLSNLDGALILDAAGLRSGFYSLDADSAVTEAVPTVMAPDSNAGDKRWVLLDCLGTGAQLYEKDTTNKFDISGSSGNWTIDNQYTGGTITIIGDNTGNKTMQVLDPAGAASLYHAGTVAAYTSAGGLGVADTSGSAPEIILYDDAAAKLVRVLGAASGVVSLQVWTGAAWENVLLGTGDAATSLYYNALVAFSTGAAGGTLRDSTGTIPSLLLTSSADATLGNLFATATSVGLKTGSSLEKVLEGTTDGALDLYYNNIKEAETISGGFKATNSLTIAATTNVTGILDEDNLTSDSATSLATQQSIKAYVDGLAIANNLVINGDFNLWQREISFAALTNGTFTADRFSYHKVGNMIHTISASSDVPTQAESDHKSNYSLKVLCTTEDDAIASGDYCFLSHKLEGYNMTNVMGNYATISFWVKATVTGTHCFAMRNSAGDKTWIHEYTINTTDTWEKKTLTVEFNDSAGTWLYTTGAGLILSWALLAGTDWQATKDSWIATNDWATSSIVNDCDTANNEFYLAQVKFEIGETATPFVSRSFAEELALCQRYYEKSCPQTSFVGYTGASGMEFFHVPTTNDYRTVRYATTKRAGGTLYFWAYSSGTASAIWNYTTGADDSSDITSATDESSFYIVHGSTLANNAYAFHWAVDSEI